MSRDLGRDVPDLEKLYAGKLWVDFLYPIIRSGPANQTKERSVHELFAGAFRNKSSM